MKFLLGLSVLLAFSSCTTLENRRDLYSPDMELYYPRPHSITTTTTTTTTATTGAEAVTRTSRKEIRSVPAEPDEPPTLPRP